jgi:pyridoxamine 5'-phosphate oxidase
MTQFARWRADALASGMPEPTAMVLSTITEQGGPRARTVLLKAHDQAGFTFYSNRTSRKGRELAGNPAACLVFPWYGIQRQVIVEGKIRELSQAESEPYYRSRPRLSQLGAWASRQSTVIASRAVLDDRVAELERRWPEPGPIPMPDFWGGYLLEPGARRGEPGRWVGAGRSTGCPPDGAPVCGKTASAARSAPLGTSVAAVRTVTGRPSC